jgi:hypothetical protein
LYHVNWPTGLSQRKRKRNRAELAKAMVAKYS